MQGSIGKLACDCQAGRASPDNAHVYTEGWDLARCG
jgi:hypothetical protein